MSIKEFTQKNGEVFFYVSIVLFIICVVLCFNVFSHKGPRNFDRNEMRGQGEMTEGRGNRQFNKENINQEQPDQVSNTSATMQNETPSGDATEVNQQV